MLLLITTTYFQAICTSQMDDNHPSECYESEIQYVYLVKAFTYYYDTNY